MYTEEVLNKGYGNNEIDAFRKFMTDPSLVFDLSKVSLDGGNPIALESSLAASIKQWNELGLPSPLKGSSGPYLQTIENRKTEDIVMLIKDGISEPFQAYLPTKDFMSGTTPLDFDLEIDKQYLLSFFIKFNNANIADISFFLDTEVAWLALYGISFDNAEQIFVEDGTNVWQKVSVTLTKESAGTAEKSRIVLVINPTISTVDDTLLFISNLTLTEVIGE